MNILLLGNGFDLNHKFPTRYIDFLQTIHYLIQNKGTVFSTVGDVFSSEALQKCDEFIKDAYSVHSEIYSNITLNQEEIKTVITLAENNLWFKYLYGSINKDIGWIDLEKEIIKVIDAFYSFLNPDTDESVFRFGNGKVMFDLVEHPDNEQAKFIIEKFDFFFESEKSSLSRMKLRFISSDYYLADPPGSQYYVLNSEKISSKLYDSLRELADILAMYLKIFVDAPSNKIKEYKITSSCPSYPLDGHVITFNYTHTYEHLYSASAPIVHIHGDTNTNIILGVNPDEKDELYEMDTTFLQFKKYFQRVFFGSDVNYIKRIKALQTTKKFDNGYTLFVIGHSLDTTDKDIIMQLFELSNRIFILYHSQGAVNGYIRNLVEIYGKEAFDEIRVTKDLQFVPQAEVEWKKPVTD